MGAQVFMPLSHSQKLSRHPMASIIGRRIILILVLISSLITLIATLIQLYSDYQTEISAVETRHQELHDVHIESLTINLWEFNERQLNIRLQGLVKLPDISFAKVSSNTGNQAWQAGTQVSGDKISKLIPLRYQAQEDETSFELGQLYVESSTELIYQKLLHTFISILVANGIKTFIVAALVLWVFHLSINKRIMGILYYLDHFRPTQRHNRLELQQTTFVTSEKDEISVLALSINQLSQTLHRLYTEIEQEKDRFTDFADASSDWLWETDATGQLIFASEQMLNQLGLNASQPLNCSLPELIKSLPLKTALSTGKDFKGLEVELSVGAEKRIFIFHAKTAQDINHSPILRGSAIEITARKQAEQALKELNESLELRVLQRTQELEKSLIELEVTQQQLIEREKMAALSSLVTGIAHEINTPLGIAITAGSMLEPKDQSSQHLEAYHLMQDSLQRVARLVQVFKQTSAKSNTAKVEPVYIKQLLNDIVVGLQQGLQEKLISVTVECDDNLCWPTVTHSWVQVFHQMISNSLCHGFSEAQPDNQIEIRICENSQGLAVHYHDNGQGMSADELSRLFEPFQTSKRHEGFTGLGMHIVYNQVAQALQGTITATSAPGEGLTISLRLPPLAESLQISA